MSTFMFSHLILTKTMKANLIPIFQLKKKNEVPRGKLTQILIQVHLTFKSVWFSLTTKANVSSLLWPVNVQVKLIFIMGKKLARGSREHIQPLWWESDIVHGFKPSKGPKIFPEFANLPLRSPGMGALSASMYLPRVNLGPGAHPLLRRLSSLQCSLELAQAKGSLVSSDFCPLTLSQGFLQPRWWQSVAPSLQGHVLWSNKSRGNLARASHWIF